MYPFLQYFWVHLQEFDSRGLTPLRSFAGKTRPPEEFSTRLLLRIPFDAQKIKKHHTWWCFCFLVHLNRLTKEKQLSVVFSSGVRQSKESAEPRGES